jgi:hypothetical protein
MASSNRDWRRPLVIACIALGSCGDDAAAGDSRGTDSNATTPTTTDASLTATTATSTPDPDTSTTADGSSSGGAETTTGEAVCPPSHACVALPPGWTGPVLLRESTDPEARPECPDEYPELAAVGGAELTASTPECDCSCGAPNGTTCALATTLHYWGTDPTCSNGTPLQSYNLFTTVCNDLNAVLPANSYFQVEPVEVDGGSCAPQQTAVVEPPIYAELASTCGSAEVLEGCEGGDVCAPRASGESLCVWQDGDSECPAGFEGDRTLVHRSIDDSRACTECTCDDPVGLCDTATITMFSNVCNPPISSILDTTGECDLGSAGSVTRSAIFDVGQPNAFCVASPAVATGTATPAEPVTICCAS